MKKIILTLILSSAIANGEAQHVSPSWSYLVEAVEAYENKAPLGTAELLLPLLADTSASPLMGELSSYLDAVSRVEISAKDAEQKLLSFIEEHPHSAYLPYAQMRLGEYYLIQENYQAASYWFAQYDPAVLGEDLEQTSYYYLAYSLLREGQNEQALMRFLPLAKSPKYQHEANFYVGYLYLRGGDLSRAFSFLNKERTHPKFGPYAQAFIAEIRLSERRYTDALTNVEKSWAEKASLPNTVQESLARTGGLAASLLGHKEVAVKYLKEYMNLTNTPGRVEMLALGKNYFELNKPHDAVPLLRKVYASDSDFMAQLACYYEGLAQLSLQQPDLARKAFQTGLKIQAYPQLTEAISFNHALAVYSLHQGELGEGVDLMVAHLNTYPNGEHTPQVVSYLTDAYLNSKDAQRALASLQGVQRLPSSLVSVREKVKLRGANRLLGAGKTEEASQAYDAIIASGKDAKSVAEAYFWKGEVAYRNGAYQEAINATRQYLALRPADTPLNPNAYYNLGYAYYSVADWQNAQASFNQYLAAKPNPTANDITTIYNRLGDIAVLQREYNKAYGLYTKAEEAHGEEADYALLKKGMTQGLLKQYDAKAHTLAGLSGHYPNSKYIPEALYEQGRALSLQANERAASVVFRRVFETYPQDPIAPKAGVQLGLTYFNSGDMKEAANIYTQVVRKYPHTPEARTALQDLKSISIELNQVERYAQLVKEVGGANILSDVEQDSLAYLAAERIVAEGNVQEAEQALENYLTKYPAGAFAQKALYNQAYLMYKNKRYPDAVNALERLLPSVNAPELKRDALQLKAMSLSESGRSGEAAEAYILLAKNIANEETRSSAIVSAVEQARKSNSNAFIIALAQDLSPVGSLVVNNATQLRVLGEAIDVAARANQKETAVALSHRLLQLSSAHTYAARAQVVLALQAYDQGKQEEAKARIQKLIDKGTTDTYWLARAFILLSDIYVKQGDKATAKTYLESVRSNYNDATDGILAMIKQRLNQL